MTQTQLSEREHALELLRGGFYRVAQRMRSLRPLEQGDLIDTYVEKFGLTTLVAKSSDQDKEVPLPNGAEFTLDYFGTIRVWISEGPGARKELLRLEPKRTDEFRKRLDATYSQRSLPQLNDLTTVTRPQLDEAVRHLNPRLIGEVVRIELTHKLGVTSLVLHYADGRKVAIEPETTDFGDTTLLLINGEPLPR